MNRAALTEKILDIKREKGWTWKLITDEIGGMSPVLVVGAGLDDRAPPETVERLFARLPMHPENRQLWMVPDSKHGHVFLDQPAAYAERLRWLLGRLRR